MLKNQEIPWKEEYRIGIDDIDKQHMKIFETINKLYAFEPYQETKENIRTVLYDFSDYMNTHFKDEEKYMLSINYPFLEEHKKLHEDIINTLHEIIYFPACLSIIKSKMKIVAKKTFIHHITHDDIKIKDFVLKQKN